MRHTEEIDGRSYFHLLKIAEKCMANCKKIDEITKNFEHIINDEDKNRLKDVSFTPKELHIIALDYSISSLEAFINYMGNILINNWNENSKKTKKTGNFDKQYEKLIKYLVNYDESLRELLVEPYRDFKKLRGIRNMLHHINSSTEDNRSSSGETNDYNSIKSLELLFEMTVNRIQFEDANSAYLGTEQFILKIHRTLEEYYPKIITNMEKKELEKLEMFRRRPLSISMVVGSYKLLP